MLSETERDSLSDILFNIDLANSFAQGFDYERFLADMRTFYAITRCLEIISEASRRLSPELKARHPEIPWRKVSGSGNIYRHEYEDVAHRLVWGTVHEFCQRCELWPKPSLQPKAVRPWGRLRSRIEGRPER
jgi:uncharacterized protein with HEPN domain